MSVRFQPAGPGAQDKNTKTKTQGEESIMQESVDTRQIGTRQILFVAAASCLGWAFEFFDLLVLLYVAPVVGSLFFPSDRPMLSLAAVYSSFAVTLLMRP